MSANGCVKVYRSGSLSLFIYCFLVVLLTTVVYGQDKPASAEKAASGDIQGKLSDSETGEWITGATVTINTSPPQTATTGKYGGFGLYGADVPMYGEKSYTLTIVVKDGDPYAVTEVPVTVKCSETVSVTIKLEAVEMLGRIRGTVKCANWGEALLGAEIRLFKDGALVKSTTTGSGGGYSFEDLEPGEYAVGQTTEVDNYLYQYENGYVEGVQVVGFKTTIVNFTPSPLLRGSVIDNDTLAGITGATVIIIGQEGESSTDKNGKFEIEVETSGNQWLFVVAGGYNPGIYFFDVSPGSADDLPVSIGLSPVEDPSLPAPGSIVGGVGTANVPGFVDYETTQYVIELYSDGGLIGTVNADPLGNFKFETLQPGTYRVVAKNLRGQQIEEDVNVEVESNEVSYVGFTSIPTGSFTGSVFNRDTRDTISGATVTDKTNDFTSTTGPDGNWSIPISNPGPIDIVVSNEGFITELHSFEITVDNFNVPPSLGIVPLPEGQAAPGIIEGNVTSSMLGVDRTDVTLKLLKDGTFYLQTVPSPGGYYIFPAVPPGTYSLNGEPPPIESIQTRDNIVVESGESYLNNFNFYDPYTGYIIDSSNYPIPGANIIFQPGHNQFTSGDDGKFTYRVWDRGTPEWTTYDCIVSKEGFKTKTQTVTINPENVNDTHVYQLETQTEGNGGIILNLRDINGGEVDPDFLSGCTISGGFDNFSNGTASIGSCPLDEPKMFEIKKNGGIVCSIVNIPAKVSVTPIDVPVDLTDLGEAESAGRAISTLLFALPEGVDYITLLKMRCKAVTPWYMELGGEKTAGTAEIEYIKGAEYFIGDDPGQGNGTPMEAVDGTFDGEIEEIITSIDNTDWEAGLKFIFLRVQYSDDTWSLIQTVGIFHEPVTLEPPSNLTVTDIEGDNGYSLNLDWELSPDDAQVTSYRIYRSRSPQANYGSGFDFYESIDEVIEAELTSTILVGTTPAGVTTFLDETILVPGADYYYWIQAQGEDAVSKLASPGVITGIDETPLEFSVSKPYPNPFNPSVTIAYTLPERRMLSVVVYDILGRKIRVLDNTIREAGSYRLRWDGLDDNGLRAGSGIYIYRLRAGEFSRQGKMLLLR